jgi:hypothetical protein
MDEQILLSDYSEVTEIITMVGGTQVSSLSAHCYSTSSFFWPMQTSLSICCQWRLSCGYHSNIPVDARKHTEA